MANDEVNENEFYLTTAEALTTVATTGSYNDLSNKPVVDKWNGVTLNDTSLNGDTVYVLARTSTSATNAYNLTASHTPGQRIVALYDSNSYLISTIPSANDNSTKVATNWNTYAFRFVSV